MNIANNTYIYLSKTRKSASEKRTNIIWEKDNLRICGDSNTISEIILDNGHRIFLYGSLFYFVYPDGEVKYVNRNEVNKLEKIFCSFSIDEIVRRLEGLFVGLSIEKNGNVTLFQDQHSRLDVFYSKRDSDWCFAMELEPIIDFLGREIEYDQMALFNFLILNYTPKKHTIYKDIRRLGIHEIVFWDNKNIKIQQIEDKPIKINEYGDCDLERYWRIMQHAVCSRASQTENWISVSGGWDSTFLLATLLKEFGTSKVKPIVGIMNYSQKGNPYNPYEIEKVKKTSQFYGLELEEVSFDLSSHQSLAYWESIKNDMKRNHLYHFGAYGAYRLGEVLRKGGADNESVLVNGDIADSVFNFGYSQYVTIKHSVLSFCEYADKMANYLYGPHFYNKIQNGTFKDDFVFQLFKFRYANTLFNDKVNDLASLVERYILPFIFGSPRIPFSEPFSSRVFRTEGSKVFRQWLSDEYLQPLYRNIEPDTFYYWLMYCYRNFHFQGFNGKQWRIGANYYDVESCQPFFDSSLIDFCYSMPEDWGRGLSFKNVKYPLKWALKSKLKFPTEIIEQGPHAYVMESDKNALSPTGQLLYESGMTQYFKDVIRTYNYKELLDDRYFDYDFIDKIVEDYCCGKSVGVQEGFLRNLLSLLAVGYY